MPLFDFWPYIDLSKLNLDWLIKSVTELQEKVNKLSPEAGSITEDDISAELQLKAFEGVEKIMDLDPVYLCGREHYYLNGVTFNSAKHHYVMGFIPMAAYRDEYSGEAVIVEVSPDLRQIIGRSVSADYGHVNDFAFVPATNKLYVAPGYSAYSQYTYKLLELDADTYEILNTYTIAASHSVTAISYDADADIFYVEASTNTRHKLYECNADFTEIAYITDTYFIDRTKLVMQSSEFIHNKFIMLANSRPASKIYLTSYVNGTAISQQIEAIDSEEPEGLVKVEDRLQLFTINNDRVIHVYEFIPANRVYDYYTYYDRPEVVDIESANADITFPEGSVKLLKSGYVVGTYDSQGIVFADQVSSGTLFTGAPIPFHGNQFGLLAEATTNATYKVYVHSTGEIRSLGNIPAGTYRLILNYIAQYV